MVHGEFCPQRLYARNPIHFLAFALVLVPLPKAPGTFGNISRRSYLILALQDLSTTEISS